MMLEGMLRVSIDSLEHNVLEPGDVLYFESSPARVGQSGADPSGISRSEHTADFLAQGH